MAAIPAPTPAYRRAAIYVRVSTGAQESDGTSLTTQEEACRTYCLAQGWDLADARIFREVHSGAHLWERPQLTRLRTDMRAGAFDVLVCYAIDRLSREQDHLGLLVSEAQHYGCTFAFVTEDWDTSPLGKFLRGATAFAAELERAKILERTSRGKRARVASGKPLPGKRAPYGYAWNEDRTAYLINEFEARIVRRIFVEIAAGETLHGMAAKLTREGVPIPWPTPQNRCTWAHGTIRHICSTPAYWGQPAAYRWQTRTRQERDKHTGAMQTRDYPVERPLDEQIPLSTEVIPPLVDPRLAQQVADRLAHNRAHVRRPAVHHDALLQGGYGLCALCDGPLMVKRGRRGASIQVRYHCRRKNDRNAYSCGCHTMSVAMLDAAVWAKVQRALREPEIIRDRIDKRQAMAQTTAAADLALIDQRLAEIASEQENLAYAISKLRNQRAADALVARLTALEAECAKLSDDRQGVQEQAAAALAAQSHWRAFEQQCRDVAARSEQMPLERRRDVLYALGIQVKLWPKDHKPRWEIEGEIDLDARGADADEAQNEGVVGTMIVRFIPGCTRHRMW